MARLVFMKFCLPRSLLGSILGMGLILGGISPAQAEGRPSTGEHRRLVPPYAARIDYQRIRRDIAALRANSAQNTARIRAQLEPRLGGAAAYDRAVNEIARRQRVEIRLTVDALEGFLRDGYFKTYRETSQNRGRQTIDDFYRQNRLVS